MASLSHVSNLVAKIIRLNKDRMLHADLQELQRHIKALEPEFTTMQQGRAVAMLEASKLKKELSEEKQKPPPDATPRLPRLVATDFVWKTEKA